MTIDEITRPLTDRLAKGLDIPSWKHLLITLPWLIGCIFFFYSAQADHSIAGRQQTTYGIIRGHEPANHNRYGYDFSVNARTYSGWQIPMSDLEVAQRVLVYYDPLDPTRNSLYSFTDAADSSLGPAVFCAAGVIAVLLAVLIGRRAQARRTLKNLSLPGLQCVTALILATGSTLPAQGKPEVAPTPPMGWNSWDSYGLTITESQFRANVDVLKTKLKDSGWRYAVIDEGWFFGNPEDRRHPAELRYQLDGYGRYVPVPTRFPSSLATGQAADMRVDGQSTIDDRNRGFVELGRWVHAQGLQFGIHIVRGIPRESVRINLPVEGSEFHAQDAADQADPCPWDPTNWGVRDNAAGQAWYDSLLKQYAAWGVDLLKVDCIADHPYKASEIRQLRRAIDKSGRPMVLSLSPGPTNLSHAAEVAELAQMWRISDDIWDVWASEKKFPQGVESQFARLAAWAPHAKPGNWPDADMLPLGQLSPKPDVGSGARATRLTFDEQQTQMTLWSIARSPLILGANLTLLDPVTLRLLTNKDLIRVDQTATRSREVLHEGDLVAWTADLPGGERALAVFNLGAAEMSVDRPWEAVGVTGGGKGLQVRDVWSGDESKAAKSFQAQVAAHGCKLYLLRR